MKETAYPTTSAEITEFLCRQWAAEFPEQPSTFPRGFRWEYRLLHVSFFGKAEQQDMKKAEHYMQELLGGAQFPPVVFLTTFDAVINGLHRLWAFQQIGCLPVPTYIGKAAWE